MKTNANSEHISFHWNYAIECLPWPTPEAFLGKSLYFIQWNYFLTPKYKKTFKIKTTPIVAG